MTESTLPPPRSRLAALIAEAKRHGRRRKLVLASLALLALLVAGGIWATLERNGGGTAAGGAPSGFHIEQSQGPVARRVLELWTTSRAVSVDLRTGKSRPVRTTSAIWYDRRSHFWRVVYRADGRVENDVAAPCPRSTPTECLELGFSMQRYWPLDTSRYTRQPGIGTFHGRRVIWIAPRQAGGFAAPARFGERIGLDPRTHQPVADRMYLDGKISTEALVLARKPDVAAGKYAFLVPNPTKRNPDKETTIELSARGSNPHADRARRALGVTPLWLGDRFEGNRLQAVTIGSTAQLPTGISPKAATYVFYDYGNVGIDEFNVRALYGAGGGPVPGRVTLDEIDTVTTPSPPGIAGLHLSRDGLYVTASKSLHGDYVLDRAAALRIARALRPVPLP